MRAAAPSLLVAALVALAACALAGLVAGCGDDTVDPTYVTLVDAGRPVFGKPPVDAGSDAPAD